MNCLSLWLRYGYYYFWLLNTNRYHIDLSIVTGTTAYQISLESGAEL